MNIYYAKTILYEYSCAMALIDQIDELVQKMAISSMTDFSPAEEQCEKILSLIRQKDSLIKLKIGVDKVLKNFSKEEIDCFDYKYFRFNKKEYFENFDSTSRAYFRRQIRLAKRFSELIEKMGFSDEVFENEFLISSFFKSLLKRVIEHESNCQKNKVKKSTQSIKKSIILSKLPAKRSLENKKEVAETRAKINNYS